IVTPYGYGGPLVVEGNDMDALVKEFEKEFHKYCEENNIVSEFVRFHPIDKNHINFNAVYETTYLRKTVGTNLSFDDPFLEEFSKSTRKAIRRVLQEDVEYQIIESPTDISSFMNVYYSTMDRNEASDYYYFDKEYFESCMEDFKNQIIIVNVLYENKVIASSFNFLSNDRLHVHLSGTLTEYIKHSPAYIIKYATMKWAKDHGFSLIHYGGGTSNDVDDNLFKFKKKFGKSTEFDFYIGKRIWNQEIYDLLCETKKVDKDSKFFPAYRKSNI